MPSNDVCRKMVRLSRVPIALEMALAVKRRFFLDISALSTQVSHLCDMKTENCAPL